MVLWSYICQRYVFKIFPFLRTKTTVKTKNLCTENFIVNKIAFVNEKTRVLCNLKILTESFSAKCNIEYWAWLWHHRHCFIYCNCYHFCIWDLEKIIIYMVRYVIYSSHWTMYCNDNISFVYIWMSGSWMKPFLYLVKLHYMNM